MKMEAVCFSEKLVPTYHTTRRHNLDDHNMNEYEDHKGIQIRAEDTAKIYFEDCVV
jgi:hypothetical protein